MKLNGLLISVGLLTIMACSSGGGNDGSSNLNEQPFKGFDVSNCGIDTTRIFNGGPGRDGVPAVLNPIIKPLAQVGPGDFPLENDLVIVLEVNGERRVYPERIMWRHEIVNDVLGGQPVVVSYCPLTGSTVAFERREQERFRVSGLLFESNLIMYDDDTDSLWPQMDFVCQCGERKGEALRFFAVKEMTWDRMSALFPDIDVVVNASRTTFSYLEYPYGTYDQLDNGGLLFPVSDLDVRYPIKSLTLLVFEGGDVKGYPHLAMEANALVVNDRIGDQDVVVFHDPSARYVNAFRRQVAGDSLVFEAVDGATFGQPTDIVLRDTQTQSIWNLVGEAIDGPMQGATLEQALNLNAMWFSFRVSFPNAQVFEP